MCSSIFKGKPKVRKDVPEGLEGVVEGWADPEMRSVLVKVNLTLEGKEVSIIPGRVHKEPEAQGRHLAVKG